MRLTLFLPTLALFSLLPALVSSTHPHALAHRRDHARDPASSVLASRQYRIPRDLLDVCINVNANLLADASQLLGLSSLLGALDLGADIQLCLCLKASLAHDLNLYLDTNDQLSALIGLLGKDKVGALITALINTSPDAKKCTFPDHAHHTCNNSDPCHYACDPPYISDGDKCVCVPPYSSCNNVCGIFPQGCSSAVPHSLTKQSRSIMTLAQAQASCKSGETVCGIAGRESMSSFECIDTSSTKDSCGGCMTPHSFFLVDLVRAPSGKDCSIIANVKSTTCSSHRCIVNTCKEGWAPSLQKDACIPSATTSKMRRVRNRSEADTPGTVVETGSNTDIGSQVTSIVKLVIDLNIHGPATALDGAPASTYPTDDLANLDTIYGLLDGVNAATSGLVASTSIPTILAYANILLDVSSLLHSTLDDCSCVTSLNIQSFSTDVNDLVASVGSLLSLCNQHADGDPSPSPSIVSSGGVPSSSPNASSQAIVVGLTTLLSSLGVKGKSGVVVDGLVSPDTASSVNGILNGLDIGPANYKRQAIPPLSAFVNATVGSNSGLLNQVTAIVDLIINLTGSAPAASSTTASTPATTSVGPIGSTSSLSNCLIDPVIFATLYQYSVNLIESPNLESFCHNTDTLYTTECSLRGLFNECPYVDTLGLEGVEADLLLAIEETQYLDDWCNANIVGGDDGSSVAGHSGTVSSPTPLSTSSVAGTVVSVSVGVAASSIGVSGTAGFASGSTISAIVSVGFGTSTGIVPSVSILGHASAPATSSILPPTRSTLANPPSTSTSSTTILTHVSTPVISSTPSPTTFANSPFTATSSSAASATTDTPITLSLDDVLSDLGLNGTKAVVTVDGLLGDQLDKGINQILNGLGIGPQNVRRRALAKVRRQTVANVNATVDLGGLEGTIDGLVNLVLGLNLVGGTLPAVSTLVPALPASTPSVPVPAIPVPLPSLSDPSPALSGPSSTLVDQHLISDVIAALLALLSSPTPTYAEFLQDIDELVAASTNSAGIMGGCSCMTNGEGYQDVYRYLVDIAEAAEALGVLCRERAGGAIASSTGGVTSQSAIATGVGASHSTATPTGVGAFQPSASSSDTSADEPIIVGLTKLLKGLGLNIDAKVVVDGLLGNSLNHGVNNILNGLGIGPNGARRRRFASQQDW